MGSFGNISAVLLKFLMYLISNRKAGLYYTLKKNIYLNPLKISFFQEKIVLLHPKLKTLI